MTDIYHEPERSLPVNHEYQCIVCGGGPAGVSAAISAARRGVKTLLIESSGCLGGIWTAGLLPWVIDRENKDGIMREITDKLIESENGYLARNNALCAFPEAFKLTVEDMCRSAGVEILLYTFAVSAIALNGRLKYVITESKSGRIAYTAEVFIDCTGDGDIAHYAGCGYDVGSPEKSETQPMSLIALVSGVDPESIVQFNNSLTYRDGASPKKLLLNEMRSAGIEPSYKAPSLFHIKDGYYLLMSNQEYSVRFDSAAALTKATLNARREIHETVCKLKKAGGVWKDIRLIATAEKIGVREGRRIHGLAAVTEADIINGVTNNDGVCSVKFGFDLHSVSSKSKSAISAASPAKQYSIPMGALIAKDVQGLLMAGRCISGDFLAHSSYRVTGDASETGESAGIIAAAVIKNKTDTHTVDYRSFINEKNSL